MAKRTALVIEAGGRFANCVADETLGSLKFCVRECFAALSDIDDDAKVRVYTEEIDDLSTIPEGYEP